MKALQILKDLALQQNLIKFPLTPLKHQIVHPYTDKTEYEFERCIIDFLEFHGWQAERIKVKATRKDNRFKYMDVVGRIKTIGSVDWIPSKMTPGSADMSATIKGRSVKIEIKLPGDTQKKKQKEYQANIEKSGGIYIIVKSFQDFYTWYTEFMKEGA